MNFGGHYPYQTRPAHGGTQHRFKFANGYGASVIRHDFSYGGKQGLWELAVTNTDGGLVYTTPVTNDVVGYLTEAKVGEYLTQIAELPITNR